VFEFTLDDKIAVERISGRRVCSCGQVYHLKFNPPKVDEICDECGRKLKIRDDQQPVVVKKRLAIYHRVTEPLIDYLNKQKKIKADHYLIDAEQSIDKIQKSIMSKL
jgi:adenylate kinase